MNLRKSFLTAYTLILAGMFVFGVLIISKWELISMPQKPQTYTQYTRQLENSTKYDGPINILLLGLDYDGERADTMVLANFDPAQSKLNLLSIERDTKVDADGRYCKINALYTMGGEEYIAQAVENMTGLHVNYYVTLNFKGFREIIDVLGGVEFDVPFDMDYDDPNQKLHIHLKKGSQLLDGDKAEQLVRYRKGNRHGEGYIEGDIGRIHTQQEFLKALITQKLKLVYLSRASELFSVLEDYMKTNIGVGDIKFYLPGISGISSEKINTYTMPGESLYENGIWYFFYNRKKTLDLINNNFHK